MTHTPATTPAVPLYLGDGPDPVFGMFHDAPDGSPGAVAVLICPPFGWDEICSYRSRREWARELAAAGFPALRIDLPGTGDSGGSPRDPAQLAAWSEAVACAARQLRARTGCARLAAIGIGLGGLLICNAIAAQAPIDDVILWGVPARGRTLVRELRVFGNLEESGADPDAAKDTDPTPRAACEMGGDGSFELGPLTEQDSAATGPLAGEDLAPAPPTGSVWAGGFLLSAETARALEELDVAALAFPNGRPRRALMLDRDGISVDKRLLERLRKLGASVSVTSGEGYGAMMAKPHLARSPRAVFAQVSAWLREDAPEERPASVGAPGEPAPGWSPQDRVGLSVAGKLIQERPLSVEQPFGGLLGILTEPVTAPRAQLCAVMLNAGAIRRIGPNRMWVESARRWAAWGVPTLRLDLQGIGDADGDGERLTELAELYDPKLVDQVCAALDALEVQGLGPRFVLAGLCSGACWSFHAALRDERVAAALMLNPRALFWHPSLEAARDLRRGALRSSSWPKILRGEVSLERMFDLARSAPFALPRRALRRRRAHRRGEDELGRALDKLRDAGKQLHFMFSGEEPLYEELMQEGRLDRTDRWPNVSFHFLPGKIHTLRPFPAQQRAHALLDRALRRELQRTAQSSAARAPEHPV
jgi:pimeloyl-ACP methyl ester carboxylesterase